MRNWSFLNPNLSSWINAFLLAGLLIIATSLVPVLHQLWTAIVFVSAWIFYFVSILMIFIGGLLPQFVLQIIMGIISFVASAMGNLITLLSPFILLLPIPIVAFAHHYLYLLLDRFYPDLDSAARGRLTGYVPGIVSWWHGLFAFIVVIMAMLVSDSILSILPIISSNLATCGVLHQVSNPEVHGVMGMLPDEVIYAAAGSSDMCVAASSRIDIWVQIALTIFRQPIYSPFLRLVIWVISAAYMYQFEFMFREHLIANAVERNGDR